MKNYLSARIFRAWGAALILLLGMLAATQGCNHGGGVPGAASAAGTVPSEAHGQTANKDRIGVYDSRAVAVAYAGSELFNSKLRAKQAELAAAKKAGDQAKAAELEAWGKEHQFQAHLQGFSTAPVDDILAEIKDQLPAIEEQARVGELVSKWDRETLLKHKGAERVDVTMALVDAFKPRAQSRTWAQQIQSEKPMPLDEAKKYFTEHPER